MLVLQYLDAPAAVYYSSLFRKSVEGHFGPSQVIIYWLYNILVIYKVILVHHQQYNNVVNQLGISNLSHDMEAACFWTSWCLYTYCAYYFTAHDNILNLSQER